MNFFRTWLGARRQRRAAKARLEVALARCSHPDVRARVAEKRMTRTIELQRHRESLSILTLPTTRVRPQE